jgi:hypothetical protein
MTTAKNPGLKSFRRPPKALKKETPHPTTALSVRLPKPMYDALLAIVYEAKRRGQKASIHGLMLEGIAKVIAEKK